MNYFSSDSHKIDAGRAGQFVGGTKFGTDGTLEEREVEYTFLISASTYNISKLKSNA